MAVKNLLARPARTTLTMFGVVIGVTVIIAISIANEGAITALNTLFGVVTGTSDLVVMSSTDDEEGFPEEARRRIGTVPNVQAAAPSVHVSAPLVGDKAPASSFDIMASMGGIGGAGLTLYGVDPTLDPEVRVYDLVEGQWLAEDLNLHEVVLVKDFADDEGLAVGDDIHVLAPDGIEPIRIVGLIAKEGAGQLNNGMFGAMPIRAAQEIFQRAGNLDQIDIIVSDSERSTVGLEALREEIGNRLGDRYSVNFPASQGERVAQMTAVTSMGISMFGTIALFVGAFLIYNAFSMTVVERTREIGMMRTIGMTRDQVTRQILIEAVILGVTGSVLGIGFGVLLARGLILAMSLGLGQAPPASTVPIGGVVNAAVTGVVVTIVAAFIPARQAGRVSPLEALRVRAQHREGWLVRRGWLAGSALVIVAVVILFLVDLPEDAQFSVTTGSMLMLFLGATLLTPITIVPWEQTARPGVQRIFGGEGRLGGSNIRRSKMRTTMTVTALMVGVAMLLSMQAMSSSLMSDITEWVDGYMGGDLYVYSSMPMRLDFGDRLEAIDGVYAAAPGRYLYVTVKPPDGSNDTVALNVVDPVKHSEVGAFTFTETMGDEEQSMARFAQGDAVFLSSLLSGRYGLGVGDMLAIQTRRGLLDFEVAGVVVDFYDQGKVIEASWRDMRQYFRVEDVNAFQVGVEPSHDPQEVMATIEDLYGTRRDVTAFSNRAMKEMVTGMTATVSSLFTVLSSIAVVVASLGVVNTLLMNVMERTREIGMLRAVGMTRWQVIKMILAESAVMGLLGGALGIVVGMALARVFIVGANSTQGYNLAYQMPLKALLFAVAVSLGVSQIAALWPSRRAARLHIIEALQYE
jgi:putative ABC transport system permease protein